MRTVDPTRGSAESSSKWDGFLTGLLLGLGFLARGWRPGSLPREPFCLETLPVCVECFLSRLVLSHCICRPRGQASRRTVLGALRSPPALGCRRVRPPSLVRARRSASQCGFCPDQPLIDLVSRRDGEVRLAMNDIGQDRHLRSPLIQIKLASWLRGQGQRGVGAD
jgi:hypothetical protein